MIQITLQKDGCQQLWDYRWDQWKHADQLEGYYNSAGARS